MRIEIGGFDMNINTNNMVSITEANQNFSRVARMVDENGSVLVLKNNAPRYLITEYSIVEKEEIAADEDVMELSQRLLTKNMEAYKVLAK